VSDSKKWLIPAAIIVLLILIYALTPVLEPFLIAAFLAYLTDPLVNWLQKYKIPRTLGVVIVFLILGLLLVEGLLVLVPLLQHQITVLIQKIPIIFNWLETVFIPWLHDKLGINISLNLESFVRGLTQHLRQAGGTASRVLQAVTSSGMTILAWLTNLVLIPVVMFYLLRDWGKVLDGVHNLIPRKAESTVVGLVKECDEVLSAFIRGQLLVMLGLGILYSFGLSIVGLDLALLIGMISGLLSIVPYLGFIVGIVAAGVAAFFQFGDVLHIVYVAVVFGISQSIESSVLTPLLIGDKIGLHPVAVIFAVLAGGQLFGFVGILLALPVAAVIMVFIRYFKRRYMASDLYTSPAAVEGDPE
tara:strand:- start:27076 stop:28152 length:1077 start_codon:yes stop_codon:yes gene_type:complete